MRALVALGVLWTTLSSAQEPLSFERYREEIEPIFLAPRGGHGPGISPCVTCHAHNGTPLKLESPQENDDGSVFWTEEQSRRNFEVVSRLVVPGEAGEEPAFAESARPLRGRSALSCRWPLLRISRRSGVEKNGCVGPRRERRR